MNIIAIIQARMTSSRLPGKVMKIIKKQPLLYYVYSRTTSSKLLYKTIIATSDTSSDNVIATYCEDKHYPYFQGSLNNVLDRFYQAAKKYQADVIIRITADCPLIHSDLIEKGLKVFTNGNYDYLSTKITRTLPIGMDFEIMNFNTLKTSWKKSTTIYEKEHVTPYIFKTKPNQFRIKSFEQNNNKSKYRLVVDTQKDFYLIKILIEKYNADKLNCKSLLSLIDKHPYLLKNYTDVISKK